MDARTSPLQAAIVTPEHALTIKPFELAAGGGFTGEKVIEISREFDTNFPAAYERRAGKRLLESRVDRAPPANGQRKGKRALSARQDVSPLPPEI